MMFGCTSATLVKQPMILSMLFAASDKMIHESTNQTHLLDGPGQPTSIKELQLDCLNPTAKPKEYLYNIVIPACVAGVLDYSCQEIIVCHK
jgi:hypothetical protein